MFCPDCHGEYRPGIDQCPTCGVDLVEDLGAARAGARGRSEAAPVESEPLLTYCGFLGLEDARQARDLLRREGIRSEIAIREAPGSDLHAPPQDEYWLRVAHRDFAAATSILGYDEAREAEMGGEGLTCSVCGSPVGAEEAFCPRCGERFDAE